ncbi:hypothetical protein SAMD00019534_001840, partial [Acytostelium subglobosum LB1]|uniref:hypothetical protein n=1 Tax=Acytostelium subglobosum LB1 TaxID=1410327 RepID=UPI0006450674
MIQSLKLLSRTTRLSILSNSSKNNLRSIVTNNRRLTSLSLAPSLQQHTTRSYSTNTNNNTTEQQPNENDLLKELFSKDPKVNVESNQARLFIQVEPTPNPDSLKFVPGIEVMKPGQTMDFPDFKSSQTSPLANAIFKLDGVNRVFYGPDFISVNKFPENEWAILKPQVMGAIVDFYHSDRPLLSDSAQMSNSDTLILPEDDEVVAMIKELIETRVRPTLIDDGGNIQYLGFKDGIVLVKLQGTCSSCSSSQATLKGGIERMLMHWISEVKGIMAVTDDELDKLNLDFFNKVDSEIGKKEDTSAPN